MKIPRPILPREHGGWALLFTPIIATVIAVREISWGAVLFTAASLAAYLAYDPLSSLVQVFGKGGRESDASRRVWIWTSIYHALSGIFFVYLLIGGYRALWIFGVFGMFLFALNIFLAWAVPKSVWRDLTAVIGLSLTCPGLYVVLRGGLDRQGFILWFLIVIFFAGSMVYVHTKIATLRTRRNIIRMKERLTVGRGAMCIYGFACMIVLFFSTRSYMPVAGIFAFLPMTIHVVAGIIKLNERVNFRRLGFLLLAQSLLFGIILGFFL